MGQWETSGASIRFSLRLKLIVLITASVVITGVLLVLYNFRRSRESLQDELRKRGSVIADNLSDAAQPLLVSGSRALDQLCESFAAEGDVAYVLVADPAGKLLAQVASERAGKIEPGELEGRAARALAFARLQPGPSRRIETAALAGGGEVFAVAVPVFVDLKQAHEAGDAALFGMEADLTPAARKSGARRLEAVVEVGISLASARRTERDMLAKSGGIVALVVLIGLFSSLVIAGLVVRPLNQLAAASEAIAEGDLAVRLSTRKSGDELNKLAAFFNHMAEELARQRDQERALREQIQRANEHKSAFLANMSHELRTPLNSIIGFTRLVQKKAGDALPAQQQENLVKVEKSAVNLLGIINDILDISKIEAGKLDVTPEPLALAELVDEVLQQSAPLVGDKPLRLVKRVPPGLPPLVSDRLRIRQVILNLVSNAIKFTPSGEVAVELEHDEAFDRIRIAVADTGIGIPEGERERVFEAFRQVDNSTTRRVGGTGLGLAIVRRLCELLGGTIELESEVARGSRFTVTLPRLLPSGDGGRAGGAFVPAHPEPAAPTPRAAAPQGGEPTVHAPERSAFTGPISRISRGRVVAIDDDPDDAHLLKELLGEQGFEVTLALSGSEGLRLARELRPELITVDIQMPELDGFTVLRELKRDPRTRDIPVVVVSIVAVDVQAKGRDLGAAGFVPKPLSARALRHVLSKEIM